MTTPIIKESIEFEDTFLQDKMKRRAYEQREKAIKDYYSYMTASKQEGIQENKIQNAINFLKLGIDIETVAKGVNLSIEEIKKIKKEYL